MIKIQNLSHQIHHQTILNNVNLDIPQGGITALIGANGAGKSTLLSFMARLRPLVSGSIAYNGRDLASTPTAQVAKMLAILTQENSIHSRIAVRDLLLFGRYPYHQGQPTAEDQAIVDRRAGGISTARIGAPLSDRAVGRATPTRADCDGVLPVHRVCVAG